MYQDLKDKKKKVVVIGLGYVGLPIALAFARHFTVIGFDISEARIKLMQEGKDPSQEMDAADFEGCDISFTVNPEDLRGAHFFIVTVPTPVDSHKVPDLTPLIGASTTIGRVIKPGDYVVYESTVYPGCTEEDCMPIIENLSGLKAGVDFKYGYSPERINPGDKAHNISSILKVVSGCDAESLEEIAKIYGQIVHAGIYKASSVKVAEAAKVVENTQRDINISLMNELAIIFDRMNINTQEVIKAASTKWNFLKFYPGLVGGHCIGVDPYYLTHKSKQLGYDPQVILSGRRVNDAMTEFIAKKLVQMLIHKGKSPHLSKVLIMGITFKEDVADIRNSKIAELAYELQGYAVNVHITDPYASPNEVAHEYKLTLVDKISDDYDAVIVAVSHKEYAHLESSYFESVMKEKPILMDIKAMYSFEESSLEYWAL